MPTLELNGLALHYDEHGQGELVVMVMGTGSRGHVWSLYQVPALVDAGYRVVTYDSRGISPVPGQTERSYPDITIEHLVDDLAGLIEHLGGAAHVVGTSLGARVVQELALARPELVIRAVAMTGYARIDPVGRLLIQGEQDLFDQAVVLPPAYEAAVTAVMNLSPATRRDEQKVREWLDVLEYSAGPMSSGERGHLGVSARLTDRRDAYRSITRPLLVIGFADDLIISTDLCREVADAVPAARYVEVPDAGHFGYLEQPELVNRLLLEFLAQPAGHTEVP